MTGTIHAAARKAYMTAWITLSLSVKADGT